MVRIVKKSRIHANLQNTYRDDEPKGFLKFLYIRTIKFFLILFLGIFDEYLAFDFSVFGIYLSLYYLSTLSAFLSKKTARRTQKILKMQTINEK